ncbi:MAG: hypothetical protein JNN15_12095, partial [Blastocatellia bacterium]|nr:hypothetical protein [Blastocatellia bacterium]
MILCQNCKTPNNASRQNCSRCGTRLMMITVRGMNQDSGLGNTLEEHLLERISMLEYLLSRMQERFERLLDLMHRHA